MVVFPAAVLVPPFDNVRLLYAIAFTLCEPVPLKLTVLGNVVVTFNVPAVMVNTFAIPNSDEEVNCKEVPFKVALYRLAVPDSKEVPVNVAVPADAENVLDISN